jgi:hypothetical protein
VVTTLAMGNSFVAAVIAIGVVIVLSALIPDRGKRASDVDYPTTRPPGNPSSISHVWKVDRKADLRAIAQALHANGFALAKETAPAPRLVFALRSPANVVFKITGQSHDGFQVGHHRLGDTFEECVFVLPGGSGWNGRGG